MIRMALMVTGICALVVGGFFVVYAMESALVRIARGLYPELMNVGFVLAAVGAVIYYVGKRWAESKGEMK